ncbi:hypothetical protein Zmor_020332 [Zophobas morio]|uniref:Uncharacterized protein n=1 Tax=Zophobas morio TaxID=2755281 RepID=A0AA38I6K4_9CUCU|nr:hypothetical protein Zmor_020332 [Zophobas morio]
MYEDMVTMTTLLVSAAELSNIFSVVAVLLCFCAMILFITRNMMVLRVHGDDFVFPNSLHQVSPRIPQMNMMKVHIPFTFKLLETSKSTYSARIIPKTQFLFSTFVKLPEPGRGRRPGSENPDQCSRMHLCTTSESLVTQFGIWTCLPALLHREMTRLASDGPLGNAKKNVARIRGNFRNLVEVNNTGAMAAVVYEDHGCCGRWWSSCIILHLFGGKWHVL